VCHCGSIRSRNPMVTGLPACVAAFLRDELRFHVLGLHDGGCECIRGAPKGESEEEGLQHR
jgi:hypothetical protein